MMCNELVLSEEQSNLPNSLVVNGEMRIPTEVCNWLRVQRSDLKTTHEEADIIVPHQVVYLANIGCQSITVISKDTDVFAASPLLG